MKEDFMKRFKTAALAISTYLIFRVMLIYFLVIGLLGYNYLLGFRPDSSGWITLREQIGDWGMKIYYILIFDTHTYFNTSYEFAAKIDSILNILAIPSFVYICFCFVRKWREIKRLRI
jgi:hypothetical protein